MFKMVDKEACLSKPLFTLLQCETCLVKEGSCHVAHLFEHH